MPSRTEPKINITVVVVFLFNFISFHIISLQYCVLFTHVPACVVACAFKFQKPEFYIYFCVLSLNHLNAREIWRLLNCKVWSPDFKYRYDEMANINKCLLVCECVRSFKVTTYLCARALTHTQRAEHWNPKYFEMSRNSHFHVAVRCRGIALNSSIISRQLTIGALLSYHNYIACVWMSELRARMRHNTHAQTHTDMHVLCSLICAFCWNGRWAITFTCKFEWKISEVSNLLSSLSWQWAVDVNDLWWIFGPWSYRHFRFQFRKASTPKCLQFSSQLGE